MRIVGAKLPPSPFELRRSSRCSSSGHVSRQFGIEILMKRKKGHRRGEPCDHTPNNIACGLQLNESGKVNLNTVSEEQLRALAHAN